MQLDNTENFNYKKAITPFDAILGLSCSITENFKMVRGELNPRVNPLEVPSKFHRKMQFRENTVEL